MAVKRFIKQKLDEPRMLGFRAEMAFMSELHHPPTLSSLSVPSMILPSPLPHLLLTLRCCCSTVLSAPTMASGSCGADALHSLQEFGASLVVPPQRHKPRDGRIH